MTDTEVDLEGQAHRLAARGREVLVERMRAAYSDAAAAQADLITLDDARIEAMVQASADRADGLQWRRALAAVATEELGISPSEALSHPAVTRAQSLVGAPSYEQSLAELMARPVPPATPAPATPAPATTAPAPASYSPPAENGVTAETDQPGEPVYYAEEPSQELESVEADNVMLELLPEPDPSEYAYDSEPQGSGYASEPAPAAYVTEPEQEPAAYEPQPEPEPQPAAYVTEPQPVEYETQAYDVEASFSEAPMPPAPSNPFAAPADPGPGPGPEQEPAALAEPPVPEPAPAEPDAYEPPTEQHHSAGVAAALAAVSVPRSVADVVEPDPPAAGDQPPAGHAPQAVPQDDNIEVSFAAVHLGGVAGLPTKREGLSVRLSADGLDIMEGPREIIGRLVWDEIEALEVPNLRMRRRQKTMHARMVVRTQHGDASFEVPDISVDELRDRVEPLMRLYGRH
jgi:hypothetical protein